MEKKKHKMASPAKVASHGHHDKHHLTHAEEVKGGKDSHMHKKEHHHAKKK